MDFQSKARTAGLRTAMMLTTGITMNMAASIPRAVMVSGESDTPTVLLRQDRAPAGGRPGHQP